MLIGMRKTPKVPITPQVLEWANSADHSFGRTMTAYSNHISEQTIWKGQTAYYDCVKLRVGYSSMSGRKGYYYSYHRLQTTNCTNVQPVRLCEIGTYFRDYCEI